MKSKTLTATNGNRIEYDRKCGGFNHESQRESGRQYCLHCGHPLTQGAIDSVEERLRIR